MDWTNNYDEGLAALCDGTHDVFLLDYRLGARSGIDLLREATAKSCSGPVILLTGQGQNRTDMEALHAGAADYLEKSGLTPALLERAIRYEMAKHAAAADLEQKVKDRTEELAQANAALKEADRRKDEFLSTLGHELRNPLAPIMNALEILRMRSDKPEIVTRQREMIERQVVQLSRLVDDLLDVSRVVAGKLRLTRDPTILSEVIDSALEISAEKLKSARVELTVNVAQIRIYGDQGRLVQVFSNLLNNAAKFTEPGGRVTVNSERQGNRVAVRVRDTGVGIPPEILPQIFDLFAQVDQHLNRSQGGLGIGLALVRRLVELHDGTVSVHSDGPGTGAEFIVVLPIADTGK